MPPRPSFWRISYLPSLRPAGAITSSLRIPAPRRFGGGLLAGVRRLGSVQESVARPHVFHGDAGRQFQRALIEQVPRSAGRAPSRAARPTPVVAQDDVVRNPGLRRRRAIRMPGVLAIVDGVGAQHGAARAANLDARRRRRRSPASSSSTSESVSSTPAGERRLCVGLNAEAGHARALHVLGR